MTSVPPMDSFLEETVVAWVEAVSGERKQGTLAQWLKDGKVLCKVANTIRPGIVKKTNSSQMPFKQMENISHFMNAAREMGVPESALFSTPDLFEEKNLGSVLNCIYTLGGVVQVTCPGFKGPALGIPMHVESKDRKREGRCLVTDQCSGFSTSMQVDRPRERADYCVRPVERDIPCAWQPKPSEKAGAEARQADAAARSSATAGLEAASLAHLVRGCLEGCLEGCFVACLPMCYNQHALGERRTHSRSLTLAAHAPSVGRAGALTEGAPQKNRGEVEVLNAGHEIATAAQTAPSCAHDLDTASAATQTEKGQSAEGEQCQGTLSTVVVLVVQASEESSQRSLATAAASQVSEVILAPGIRSPPMPMSLSPSVAKSTSQSVLRFVEEVAGRALKEAGEGAEASDSLAVEGDPALESIDPAQETTLSVLQGSLSSGHSAAGGTLPTRPGRPVGAVPTPLKVGRARRLHAEKAPRREALRPKSEEEEGRLASWLAEVTRQPRRLPLASWLKDGQVLCALANACRPGIVKKVYCGSLPFKQLENIAAFLAAARALGVPERCLFAVPDLWDRRDMAAVLSCLRALDLAVQKSCPEFKGPHL